jgi:hypothetical protein
VYSSDADAEVLADYVVALVTTKDTDASIRRNCLDSLSDFLQDSRYCALVPLHQYYS